MPSRVIHLHAPARVVFMPGDGTPVLIPPVTIERMLLVEDDERYVARLIRSVSGICPAYVYRKGIWVEVPDPAISSWESEGGACSA